LRVAKERDISVRVLMTVLAGNKLAKRTTHCILISKLDADKPPSKLPHASLIVKFLYR